MTGHPPANENVTEPRAGVGWCYDVIVKSRSSNARPSCRYVKIWAPSLRSSYNLKSVLQSVALTLRRTFAHLYNALAQTWVHLFLIRFNSVSDSFESTQIMTHNCLTRLDSNPLTTQNEFLKFDSNRLTTSKNFDDF